MKYVILSPQPIPKQETAHHRPRTLGEMKLAFLNANNRKAWADDEVFPERIVPMARSFMSPREFSKALKEQKLLLAKREKQRFHRDLHTVPDRLSSLNLDLHEVAVALMRSPNALLAAEYFTLRNKMYDQFFEEDLKNFVYDPAITEFVELLPEHGS